MWEFKFEKLVVWQKAIEYANLLYSVTDEFPSRENFGLTSQLRRAAVSVSSNIAEGNSRSSRADYARFIEIAYGSLMETVSQLHIARLRQFCNQDQFRQLTQDAAVIARMLSGLRSSLTSDH